MQPELIADYECITGEGPLWHPDEQRLYWIDIPTGRLFRYEPATGKHELCYTGGVIGGMTIQADGSLLLFMARGAIQIWREGEVIPVLDSIADEEDTRFNDVIAAPQGRVFCGTMPTSLRPGRLYRLDPDMTLTLLLEGVGCSNGLGFSPDRRRLYYADSPKCEVYAFDYAEATGEITNQRVFARMAEAEGYPDGLTVDAEGYVWCAKWDGSSVVRYAPDGREDRRIAFPVRKVSSVTFGGKNYDELYVTTAGANERAADGELAGALFRVRPGVKGAPEFRSRIGL